MDSGGLNLPGVEKAMLEMDGGTAEDLKEKFARLGRRVSRALDAMKPGSRQCIGLDPGNGDSIVAGWYGLDGRNDCSAERSAAQLCEPFQLMFFCWPD